jgi:hypothetical protein
MTPDVITSLVSTLGVVGALVWYLYHNTTKTIPDLTDKYTKANENIATKFSDTLKEERNYRREEIDSLKTWIRSEAACRYNKDNPTHHEIKR